MHRNVAMTELRCCWSHEDLHQTSTRNRDGVIYWEQLMRNNRGAGVMSGDLTKCSGQSTNSAAGRSPIQAKSASIRYHSYRLLSEAVSGRCGETLEVFSKTDQTSVAKQVKQNEAINAETPDIPGLQHFPRVKGGLTTPPTKRCCMWMSLFRSRPRARGETPPLRFTSDADIG